MIASEVFAALAEHHKGDEWVFMGEVRNGTGFQRSVRTADALAISLWPSRGLYAQGYEIKVSKSDLAAELKDPTKADEIARFCRHWFLATPKGLTDGVDIPAAWGIVEVNDSGKLKWKRPAIANEHVEPPSWLFFASIVRSFGGATVPRSVLNEMVSARVAEREKKIDEIIARRVESLTKESANKTELMRQKVERFESISGVKLDRYGSHFQDTEIAEAVRVVRRYQHHGIDGAVVSVADRLKEIATDIEALAKTAKGGGAV